ncbi:MAG: hypothetical protein IT373_25495 [Polyangiaceae bacterium]|nr:hypothetical protein [Polyangiaceae bacterium]
MTQDAAARTPPRASASRFEGTLVLHDSHRARMLRAAALAWLAGGLVGGIVLGLATRQTLGPLTLAVLVATLAGSGVLLELARRAGGDRKKRLAATADARGLELAGRRPVAARALAAGYVVPTDRTPRVCLVGQRGEVVLELGVANETEAHALLTALDLEVSTRAAEYRLAPGVLRGHRRSAVAAALLAVWGLLTALAAKALGPASLAIGLLGMLAAFAVAATPTVLRVGRDGVAIRWLRRRRFVAYAELERVEPTLEGLALVTGAGERVAVVTPPFEEGEDPARELRDAIVARIDTALAGYRARAQAAASARLERGGRATDAWVGGLQKLAGGSAEDYRLGAVTRDALWHLVEDPGVPLPTRAAAAVAAGATGEPEAGPRLRATARAVASPALRAALDGVASGADPAALGRALEAVDEEARRGQPV